MIAARITSSWVVVDGVVYPANGARPTAPRVQRLARVCAMCSREFHSRGRRLWCSETCRPYRKFSNAGRRARLKAAGLCLDCGRRQAEGARCRPCAERHAERQREAL